MVVSPILNHFPITKPACRSPAAKAYGDGTQAGLQISKSPNLQITKLSNHQIIALNSNRNF